MSDGNIVHKKRVKCTQMYIFVKIHQILYAKRIHLLYVNYTSMMLQIVVIVIIKITSLPTLFFLKELRMQREMCFKMNIETGTVVADLTILLNKFSFILLFWLK